MNSYNGILHNTLDELPCNYYDNIMNCKYNITNKEKLKLLNKTIKEKNTCWKTKYVDNSDFMYRYTPTTVTITNDTSTDTRYIKSSSGNDTTYTPTLEFGTLIPGTELALNAVNISTCGVGGSGSINTMGAYNGNATLGSGGSAAYIYGLIDQSFYYNDIKYTMSQIEIQFTSEVNVVITYNYSTNGEDYYFQVILNPGNGGTATSSSDGTDAYNTESSCFPNAQGSVGAGGICSITTSTNNPDVSIPPQSAYVYSNFGSFLTVDGVSGSQQNTVGENNGYTSSGSGINSNGYLNQYDYDTNSCVTSYPDGPYTAPEQVSGMAIPGSNNSAVSRGGGNEVVPGGFGAGGANVPNGYSYNGYNDIDFASGSQGFCELMYVNITYS